MEHELQNSAFRYWSLRTFLDTTPDLIFFKDVNLRYQEASLAFVKMVGCHSAKELIGLSDYDLFNEDLAKRYTEDDRKVIESGVPIIGNVEPLPDQSGKKSYSATSKYLIRDGSGKIIGLCGVGRDVTSQVELEEERERRELSRHMFEDVLEADVTENKMLRLNNSQWGKRLGLSMKTSFSDAIKIIAQKFIHPDYAVEFQSHYNIQKLIHDYENGTEDFSHITYQSSDGINFKWIEFSSRLYYSCISGTLRITTFLKDLDDEIKTREILRRKAEMDSLTGLYNRESTLEQLKKCFHSNSPGVKHALLFIDLDCFKTVNDSLGHPFGDKVLKSIAEKLRMAFRREDIVGRIGGDEFLVLLKNVASVEEAQKRAKQIFNIMPYYRTDTEEEICVTFSVGGAMYQEGKTLEEIYAEADEAMYLAKNSGKNTLVFYKPKPRQ